MAAVGVYLVRKTSQMWTVGPSSVPELLDVLPEAAQRIRDFHRVQVKDGRKVWEVSAREAQYYQEDQLIAVIEPRVSFFLEDGREVGLRGSEGRILLVDRDLSSVELQGGIEVRLGEYSLRTESARFDRAANRIDAPGRVELTGDDFTLAGDRMSVHLNDGRLSLAGEVATTLRPHS
jgi:LPS export ABC transporter protein LptC